MLCNMNDILRPAQKGKYAVGFFNSVTLEMTDGLFQAAEKLNAPVIIGTAQVLLTSPSLQEVADMLIGRAKRSPVKAAVHFDHGYSYELCMQAMKLGFTSVMYDCSTAPYEENVERLKEMCRIAHALGVTVEGELGHVGDNEGAGKLTKPSDFYTDPVQAADFAERTGVDALAIAVGNAHGAYKFPPKLDFDRITEIANVVDVPLVLHGGSGLADDDFHIAVQRGIAKVNIFTDINKGQVQGMKNALAAGAEDAYSMIPYEVKAVQEVAEEKMRLFSSVGHGTD